MATFYPEHERLTTEVRRRGTSLSRVAAQMGVFPGSVTAVSQGIRRSKRIEEELATAIGTTPEKLFPDRYTSEETTR